MASARNVPRGGLAGVAKQQFAIEQETASRHLHELHKYVVIERQMPVSKPAVSTSSWKGLRGGAPVARAES
eukprot:7479554-Karenia_brevis.AAC.1